MKSVVDPTLRTGCALVAAAAAFVLSSNQTWAVPQDGKPADAPVAPKADTPAATTPAKNLPKAIDIVHAAQDAMGGKKKFEAIESTAIRGQMDSPMGPITMDLKSAKPNRFLMKQGIAGMGENTMGSDGTTAWVNNWSLAGAAVLDLGDYSMQIGRNQTSSRSVNLSGFYRASLRFNVRRVGIDTGDPLTISVGGVNLGTLDGSGMSGSVCTNPGGFGTDQMLLYWEHEGVRFRPDVVVLAFAFYHLERNLAAFRFFAKPRFVLGPDGGLALRGTPVPTPAAVLERGDRPRPPPLSPSCAGVWSSCSRCRRRLRRSPAGHSRWLARQVSWRHATRSPARCECVRARPAAPAPAERCSTSASTGAPWEHG